MCRLIQAAIVGIALFQFSHCGPLKLSARDDIDHALAQPVLAKRDAFLPDVSPHHHVKRSPAPQTPLFSAEESNAVAQQILDIMAFPLNEDSSLFAEDRNLLIAQVSLLKTLPASAPHIDKIERLEEALNQIGVSEPGAEPAGGKIDVGTMVSALNPFLGEEEDFS